MSAYPTFLARVLSKSYAHGKIVVPEKLVNRIAGLEDPLNYAGTGDGAHDLYCIFLEDFPFLDTAHCMRRNEGHEFSEEEIETAAGILRWVHLHIEGYAEGKVSPEDLAATLFTMMVLAKSDRYFWREFLVRTDLSRPFIKAISSLLENLKIVPQPDHSTGEKDIEECNQADATGDFVTLNRFSQHLRGFYYYNDVLRSVVKLLAYHDFAMLLTMCSSITSTMVAKEILDALPSRLRFHIACKCTSKWIKFTCIALAQQDRRQKRFSKQTHRFAVDLIKQLLVDTNSRDQFLEIYCTNPSQYPVLQEALGEALTSVSNSLLDQYVTGIKVDWHIYGRDEVATCLKSFKKKASSRQQEILFEACYKRWLLLIDQNKDGVHHFEPFKSELDYGVITYIADFISDEDIEMEMGEIGKDIECIMNEWHYSSTDPITLFHKLLSKGQPYCHVINLRQKGGGALLSRPSGFYDFCGVSNNLYLKIKYHCDWVGKLAQ